MAADFAIDRVRLSVAYDALKPDCYCTAAVYVYGATARPRDGDGGAGVGSHPVLQQAAAAFFGAVKDHLSVGTCAAMVKMNRHGPLCGPSSPSQ